MDRGYANFDVDLDAGGDRAREGRHLHHAERARRRRLQGLGREDRRQPGRAGVASCAADASCAGRHLLAQADHADHRTHEAAARRRRLRVREDRPGAEGERGDQGDRTHVRRRPGQPRLRAPRHLHGTTGINDDVLRREMRQMEGAYLSNRRGRALQAAPAAPAVHREGRGRDEPGAGHADLVDVDFEIEGRPAGPVQRRHRLLRVAVGDPERQLRALELHGHRQPRRAEINAGRYSKAFSFSHTDPYTTIDGVPRTISARLPRRHAVHVVRIRISRPRPARSAVDYGWPITEYQSLRHRLAAQRSDLSRPRAQRRPGGRLGAQQRQHVHVSRSVIDGDCDDRSSSTSTAPSSTRTSSRSAGRTTRATARSSPTAARGIASTSATRCPAATSSTTRCATTTCSSSRSGAASRSCSTRAGLRRLARRHHVAAAVPPVFFAGGPESVRGFRESRLGPKDNFGNPVRRQHEDRGADRAAAADAGEMAQQRALQRCSSTSATCSRTEHRSSVGRTRPGPGVTPVDYEFVMMNSSSRRACRAMAGAAGRVPVQLRHAAQRQARRYVEYKDEIEGFQFSIGQAF